MDKKTALLNLKAWLQSGEKVVTSSYVKSIEGKLCYCAVGHLMKDFGVDMKPFLEDTQKNGSSVDQVDFLDYAQKLTDEGFKMRELMQLQIFNDDGEFEALESYIDSILEAEGEVNE